jgi:hypothetical protein
MPDELEPTGAAPAASHQAFRAAREVRHTVIRVITLPGVRRRYIGGEGDEAHLNCRGG